MKKLFFVILSNLLLPISVLGESCQEILKGKNYEPKSKSVSLYIAWDSKEWTTDTNWSSKCSEQKQNGFFATFYCDERKYTRNTLNNRLWVEDKSGRSWEIFDTREGDANSGTYPCKKISNSEYSEITSTWSNSVIDGVGVNLIIRADEENSYSVYTPNF